MEEWSRRLDHLLCLFDFKTAKEFNDNDNIKYGSKLQNIKL